MDKDEAKKYSFGLIFKAENSDTSTDDDEDASEESSDKVGTVKHEAQGKKSRKVQRKKMINVPNYEYLSLCSIDSWEDIFPLYHLSEGASCHFTVTLGLAFNVEINFRYCNNLANE